jgi:hypothetical protein
MPSFVATELERCGGKDVHVCEEEVIKNVAATAYAGKHFTTKPLSCELLLM